ncbi:hypothetical protein LOZ66_004470 [Ophidiomyces ophidiicola]|nr:hypothetical protein LOZ66_004470 [Ophidiomyces ophidiicola]
MGKQRHQRQEGQGEIELGGPRGRHGRGGTLHALRDEGRATADVDLLGGGEVGLRERLVLDGGGARVDLHGGLQTLVALGARGAGQRGAEGDVVDEGVGDGGLGGEGVGHAVAAGVGVLEAGGVVHELVGDEAGLGVEGERVLGVEVLGAHVLGDELAVELGEQGGALGGVNGARGVERACQRDEGFGGVEPRLGGGEQQRDGQAFPEGGVGQEAAEEVAAGLGCEGVVANGGIEGGRKRAGGRGVGGHDDAGRSREVGRRRA